MQICYAQSPLPTRVAKSLFLAGPTPRASLDPNSGWRDEAMALLKSLGYDGVVYIPEPDGSVYDDYDRQLEWEVRARERSDIIVFWIPRDLQTMPAFTTNIEFGEDMHKGRILYGRPNGAPKTRYLDMRYTAITNEAPFDSLRALLTHAVALLGEGAERTDGECCVPLDVWKSAAFQGWYQGLTQAGHTLVGATVQRTLSGSLHAGNKAFGYLLHAEVEVAGENRVKSNESVLLRPDVASIVVLLNDGPHLETVLIKEFRTPGGYVLEVPGGSSMKPMPMIEVALAELFEETGLAVHADRLTFLGSNALLPTLSSHKAHGYALLTTKEEADILRRRAQTGVVLGADQEERITLTIRSVNDLDDTDWGVQGLVAKAQRTLKIT